MSYTINGKVFTDHPLMDEMVFHLDRIMKEIVLKDEDRALNEETKETLEASEVYMGILNSLSHFRSFPFTKEMMRAYGFTAQQTVNYIGDRNRIPEHLRDDFLSFCEAYFVEEYEEKNNYYRTLMGLPEYGSEDRYFVFVDAQWLSDEYLVDLIDTSLPIHMYSQYQISVLEYDGIVERLQSQYKGRHYEYLHHLGDRRIDLYKARQASKWDILYIPTVEHLITDRFNEIYQINRTSYLQRVYSTAYKIYSDHYEEIMMVMLLCQTYTDMIADIPEWYIRRDVFDLRTCQYFIEAHGVQFFKQIPLKYQINIVKNLNKLIRYKSTNQNIWDILDLFGMDNTTVYKYYLLKRRKIGMDKQYLYNADGTPAFDLEFVKTPIGDTYDNTIKDAIFRNTYDDLTYSDKYWDGEDEHLYVHEQHMEKDFTIEGTKYMSLENEVSMKEYQFQMSYFLGLLLDSDFDTDDLKIPLPEISPVVNFRIADLFLLLFCFTGNFDGYGTAIKIVEDEYPTGEKPPFHAYEDIDGGGPLGGANVFDVDGGPPEPQEFYTDFFGGLIQNYVNPNIGYIGIDGFYPEWEDAVYPSEDDFEYYDVFGGDPNTNPKFTRPINGGGPALEYTVVNQDTFWEWMRWNYEYFWVDPTGKVLGFNMKADLEELKEFIGVRHSSFGFEHGYTLEDFGVQMFISANSVESLDDLMHIYKSNKEAYDNLYDLMADPETRDDMVVIQFIYDYLFTKEFDIGRYTLHTGEVATDYVDILKERNYILWKYYQKVTKEPDLETRQDMVRQAMNDVVGTLSYYLSDECLKYIFGFTSVASQDAMLKYIQMMIDFFKSFKVYFLDPHVTYIMDNKVDNNAHAVDMMTEIKEAYWKKEHHYASDMVETHESIDLIDHHGTDNQIQEVLDIIPCFEPIPEMGTDFNGGIIGDMDHLDLQHVYFDENPDTITMVLGEERIDLDGGVADSKQNIPFVMINGGRVEEGWDIWDLDGGGPTPHTAYLNVDGMYAESGLGKQDAFTIAFSVDGGHPDMHLFSTPSMNVRVVDRQIEASVRLHNSSKNLLTSDTNGLLLSKDAFIEDIDIREIRKDAQEMFDYYSKALNDALDNINFSTLDEVNIEMINKQIETYFVLPNQIYQDFMDSSVHGGHVQRIKEYMDGRKHEITDLIQGYNILGWDKF